MTYRDREKQALLALAMSVASDPRESEAHRRIAHQRLTSHDLDEIEVDHLTDLELDTLHALLAKCRGDRVALVLRVVGEPEPEPARPRPCPRCVHLSPREIAELDGYIAEKRAANAEENDHRAPAGET